MAAEPTRQFATDVRARRWRHTEAGIPHVLWVEHSWFIQLSGQNIGSLHLDFLSASSTLTSETKGDMLPHFWLF